MSRYHKSMTKEKIEEIEERFPWIKNADIENARIDGDYCTRRGNRLLWVSGVWNGGLWNNGTWKNGVWKDGVWKDGLWKNGIWKNGLWNNGTWKNGVWKDGDGNSALKALQMIGKHLGMFDDKEKESLNSHEEVLKQLEVIEGEIVRDE